MKFNYFLATFIYLITFNLYSDKYVIGHWGWGGMGVCLTSVLQHLSYCKKHNLTPIIFWHGSLYHNPKGFNGKTNEWEYYFNPVSSLKYNKGDVLHCYCTFKDCEAFSYRQVTKERRKLADKLISQYISLNPILKSKVNKFYQTYIKDKKTIAIHIRGTDKNTEEKPVIPEIMVKEALKHADTNTQFFIASDDSRLFNKISKLLKNKPVIYYDCYRSIDNKPLHYVKNKKPCVAQLGEDVIIEMWLMSKCNMLIHTPSNVSSIPLYINSNLKNILVKG